MVFRLTGHDNRSLFQSIEVFNGLVAEVRFDFCDGVGFWLVSHKSGLVFEPREEGGAFFLEVADGTWCGHPVCRRDVRWDCVIGGVEAQISRFGRLSAVVDFEEWRVHGLGCG